MRPRCQALTRSRAAAANPFHSAPRQQACVPHRTPPASKRRRAPVPGEMLFACHDRLPPLRSFEAMKPDPTSATKACLLALFDELFEHDGFGALHVEMRILRRGQKEVILDCGKQYRFVVDFDNPHGRASRRANAGSPGDVGSPAADSFLRASSPGAPRASEAEVALANTMTGDLT